MQSGIHAANTIKRRLHGKEAATFTYRDLGSMATISRFHAVVSFKGIRASGFLGWLMWLVVHITFLTGFKNRLSALFHWAGTFLAGGRAERTITMRQVIGRVAIEEAGGDAAHPDHHRGTRVERGDDGECSRLARRYVGPDGRPGAVGALADGVHAGLPHHPGAAGCVLGGDDADRELPGDQARRRGRAAAGAAVVEVHGGDLRGRCGDRAPCSASSSACCGRSSWASGAERSGSRSPSRGSSSSPRPSSSRSTSSAGAGSSPGRTSGPGCPIALAGILGSISVVSANAWMNAPEGVTLELRRQGHRRRPDGRDLQQAMPLMAAHMVVAAYLVGGFLIASVYAVGMLRGRSDRYHRLAFIIGVLGGGDRDARADGGR